MRSARGFTLIELLVVVAIIALLISILIPSLNRARDQAKFAVCASNQRQVITAAITYATEETEFPPQITHNTVIDRRGRFWAKPSWINYHADDPAQRVNGGAVWPYLGRLLPSPMIFICPLSPGAPKALNDDYQAANTKYLHASYYLMWNYGGFEIDGVFGPRNPSDQRAGLDGLQRIAASNQLLTADRIEWNDPDGFRWDTTHKFPGGQQHREETISKYTFEVGSAITNPDRDVPDIRNNGGFVDGHVEPFESKNSIGLRRRMPADARVYVPIQSAPYADEIYPRD